MVEWLKDGWGVEGRIIFGTNGAVYGMPEDVEFPLNMNLKELPS